MKVLQFIPNLNTGGAEIMMENLSRQLANMDIELKVICFYQGETHISRRLGEEKIEIVYLDKKMGFDFSILRKIRKIVLDFKPDVLHTHLNILPYVFLATRKTKIVHTIHSIASKEQVGFEKKICKFQAN